MPSTGRKAASPTAAMRPFSGIVGVCLLICVLAWPRRLPADSVRAPDVSPAPAAQNIPEPPYEVLPPGEATANCPVWQCGDFSRLPANFHPWWEAEVIRPLTSGAPTLQMGLEPVILGTLRYSPQICVLREVSPIREESVIEAEAEFDPKVFVETKFLDTSDPTGSSLTVGPDQDRLIDQNWNYNNGIRKKSLSGAQIELGQKIGYENSNSIYFTPPLQGNARLSLNITQPLLNGAGKVYNSRLIVLAQIETLTARDKVSKDLQAVVLDVYQTYWDLHLQRALLLQKRKLYDRGVDICRKLEGRREVDAVGGQLARAKAAVASRYGAMIRQETLLLNADAKLRTLINDPNLLANRQQELVPAQLPVSEPVPVSFHDSLILALKHRPEIDEVRKELQATCVREDVAKNELRPVLNLILTSYVSGLQGDVNIGRAMGDQFTQGRPTYSTGAVFEYPLGNRAAWAKMHKRQLEFGQLTCQLAAVTLNVRLDVENAVREIETSYQETLCQAHAVVSNLAEINYLQERWEASLDDQRSSTVLLDDLFNAHDRLARSEGLYAEALVRYNAGFATLNKAMGTLIDCELLRRMNRPVAPSKNSNPPPPPAAEAKSGSGGAAPTTAGNPWAAKRR
jgi:outer membrane protein TolC